MENKRKRRANPIRGKVLVRKKKEKGMNHKKCMKGAKNSAPYHPNSTISSEEERGDKKRKEINK